MKARAAQRPSFRILWLLLIAAVAAASPAVRADAGWFTSGDTQLRLDLQLLNDAEVIVLPLNQWPLPRAAVQYALTNAKEHFAVNNAVAAALQRVRARAEIRPARRASIEAGLRGGKAGLWRDFDTLAREDGELGARASYDGDRVSLGVELTAVADPDDGHELRADGSQVTVQLGNWLLSANEMDRWWGPGHEGSLILSNNARPMPTFLIERAEARPFGFSWLQWLGPYRVSFAISQMEQQRQDVSKSLFMAWRVVVMPFNKIELGFSRTAQFCGNHDGQGEPCDLNTFGNMLAGNDNPGFDSTVATEPGNQMAGFDLRWNSPIGNFPYALYGQYIGEDESSYLPAKYLSQLGLEAWRPFGDGGLVQGFLEYTSTTCSANSGRGPYYNCAYNQGRYDVEGYRYHDRVIGYTSDRDAENWALGFNYSAAGGALWTATARKSRLNRDDFDDVRNTVASVPTSYDAIEFGWKGKLFGEPVSVDLGVQSQLPAGGVRDTEPFGFIGWRHKFGP